jgi:uncharacterized protein (DUF58 family)
MNRSAGTGLMAFSVVLIIVGAILDFAVDVTASGFSINTVGLILLIAGIALFLVSAAVLFSSGRRSSTLVENVRSTPAGQQRVVEERDNLSA